MQEDTFVLWLQKKKNFSEKSARDVLSRFRRVENILDVSLNSKIGSNSAIENILQRIHDEIGDHLKPGSQPQFIVSQLRRAVRLYIEYNKGLKKV